MRQTILTVVLQVQPESTDRLAQLIRDLRGRLEPPRWQGELRPAPGRRPGAALPLDEHLPGCPLRPNPHDRGELRRAGWSILGAARSCAGGGPAEDPPLLQAAHR